MGGAPRLAVTAVEAGVAAAEAGIGLASRLSYQVAEAVGAGWLVTVLGDCSREALPVHLVFDGRRRRGARCRTAAECRRLTRASPRAKEGERSLGMRDGTGDFAR